MTVVDRFRCAGPANVFDIVRGRLKGYTLDRLFACLNALDQDIEIVVRPKREANRRGHVVVSVHEFHKIGDRLIVSAFQISQ